MQLASLRSKIFLFVVLTLMLGAGLIMLIAQKDVIQTVTALEERTTDNVLNLLVQDSKYRWDYHRA